MSGCLRRFHKCEEQGGPRVLIAQGYRRACGSQEELLVLQVRRGLVVLSRRIISSDISRLSLGVLMRTNLRGAQVQVCK